MFLFGLAEDYDIVQVSHRKTTTAHQHFVD